MIIIYLRYQLQLHDVTFYISLHFVLLPQCFMIFVFNFMYIFMYGSNTGLSSKQKSYFEIEK